jgi:hypothetical protein
MLIDPLGKERERERDAHPVTRGGGGGRVTQVSLTNFSPLISFPASSSSIETDFTGGGSGCGEEAEATTFSRTKESAWVVGRLRCLSFFLLTLYCDGMQRWPDSREGNWKPLTSLTAAWRCFLRPTRCSPFLLFLANLAAGHFLRSLYVSACCCLLRFTPWGDPSDCARLPAATPTGSSS